MSANLRKPSPARFTFQAEEFMQRTEEKRAGAPPRDEIDRQQVDGAKLALTIHFRGLERSVPLHLSSDVIAMLATEAELRGINLGELVGGIVAGAVVNGLSSLLEGESSAEDASVACRH